MTTQVQVPVSASLVSDLFAAVSRVKPQIGRPTAGGSAPRKTPTTTPVERVKVDLDSIDLSSLPAVITTPRKKEDDNRPIENYRILKQAFNALRVDVHHALAVLFAESPDSELLAKVKAGFGLNNPMADLYEIALELSAVAAAQNETPNYRELEAVLTLDKDGALQRCKYFSNAGKPYPAPALGKAAGKGTRLLSLVETLQEFETQIRVDEFINPNYLISWRELSPAQREIFVDRLASMARNTVTPIETPIDGIVPSIEFIEE